MRAADPEYREISESYEELRRELQDLFKVGTNKAAVNDLLRQADRYLERGDYDRARLEMSKAQSTARRSTAKFLESFMMEVRNMLLSVRTIGGNISIARPMLIPAKTAINKREYRKAATLILGSVQAIKGLDQSYIDGLMDVAKVDYNLTLVESWGLDVKGQREMLQKAKSEVRARHFENARLLSDQVREEVRSINREWTRTSRMVTDARMSIEDARDRNADVKEAQLLLEMAVKQVERNELEVARELLTDVADLAERASPQERGEKGLAGFVRRKQRTAKEAITRTKGMGADVSDAEMQYAVAWKRQQEGDMEGALKFYSRAIDEAIDAGKAMAWKGG